MAAPLLLFYIVWSYAPMYGIQVAFMDFSPRKGFAGSSWVGLRYFTSFFNSAFAWRVIRNTLVINFWNLLFEFPLPIIFALMLNEIRRNAFKRMVQTITYMPCFISLVIICGILIDFCSTDGVFGAISSLLGIKPVNLLGNAKYFRTIYVASEIWQNLGWNSILFLSALTTINPELFEAATIDGAGRLGQIWHVTLPGLLPTIAILFVLRIGSMMSIGFEKIILLYNGLTYETADVVSSFVYRKGLIDADYGYATAVGLFNSVINFALVIIANKASAVMTETSLW
ncbi:MAG: ABC transporter permease subunit [Clostridia bacterium]|nr:ABC transporter permease subunit [Clostridia bacterium]